MLNASRWILSLWVICVHGVTRPPTITKEPPSLMYFKPGDTLHLVCEGNGEPWPTFTWTRNSQDFDLIENDDRAYQLEKSGTFVINFPEEKDEGIFQCLATNDFGTAMSINVHVRAARMEAFERADDTIHAAILGTPLTLPCIPPASEPPAEVLWVVVNEYGGFEAMSFDVRITMDGEYGLNFANIREVDERDGHAYMCLVMNDFLRKTQRGPSHYIKIEGETPPPRQGVNYMWSDQEDILGLRGETLSIKCIFSGYPTPDVLWERTDNKPLSFRAQFPMSLELKINNLQFEDAGSYQCSGDNSASHGKRISRVFNVRVAAKPEFVQKPENVEAYVGATVHFHCQADADPPADIRWFANGKELSDRFKVTHENAIQIENVELSDHMVLQCNASNTHGYVFASAYLKVLSAVPVIFNPLEPLLMSTEGDPVKLSCGASGNPDPVITWFKDGMRLVTGGRYQKLTNGDLQIDPLTTMDAGRYKCEARNTVHIASSEGVLCVRRNSTTDHKAYCSTEGNTGHNARFAWSIACSYAIFLLFHRIHLSLAF